MQTLRPIEWLSDAPPRLTPGRIRLLDQTRLPSEVAWLETEDLETVWQAIRTLQVRGAPAIGIAAAMGVAAWAQQATGPEAAAVLQRAEDACDRLATARPTAVNLFWALNRMRRVARAHAGLSADALRERLASEAVAIRDEDAAMCRAIGGHGAALLHDGDTVLTHCNAGALATSELGTALAPIYVAQERGLRVAVIADETRPLLQGARLTAWELQQAGVDVTLICDNMAAQVMREGRVSIVFVGADRIAANGDTANKIGTYGVAVLARAHRIPFYVLAPSSTFDPDTADGDAIPIEQRGREEVAAGFGRVTAPPGVKVYSPAFDVTPVDLITGFVTERGIGRSPADLR
jgi:methylthioribose-1-phosphate isomerase